MRNFLEFFVEGGWLGLVVIFFVYLYWKVFARAGYSGWLSLLMAVPLVNVAIFVWFAFSDWPVAKKARGAP